MTGSATVRYTAQGEARTIPSLISDVSLSGIGLYLDIPLENEIKVALDITFMSSEGSIKTDSIEGRIVYVREINNVYFTGIQFVEEISLSGQPSLYRHLESLALVFNG